MKRFAIPLIVASALAFGSAPALLAQSGETDMRHLTGAELIFNDIQPPGFDPGMKIAVVHGDPDAPAPYVLRLSFPDGYRFPAHWHPMDENVTVLSGTFLLQTGATRDEGSLHTSGPGDYLSIPARMQHFGGASGPTVIQLHGIGPFTIELGDPDEG